VVLILGRLSPVKDVSLALRVLSRVRREIPRLRGWIAGDGPCRRRLEKEARELDLEACVHFLGLRDDAHRLLGGADALLLTSKSEGVPIAVLEARAAGCPVIATRVGGLMDVLGEDPEGDGWLTLCPQGREDELSIALSRVLRRGPVSPSPVRPGPGEPMTCPVETLARAHRELYRRLVPRPDREPPKA
jgi:glycosyltransferase involved in cell wall biosynthesis